MTRILRRATAILAGLLFATSAAAQVVVATLPVGGQPSSVAINPITNKTYVANLLDGTVTAIHNGTHAKTTISGVAFPVSLAVNPRTNRVYAAAEMGSPVVTVIDGATDAVIASVPTGAGTTALALNAVTNRIYAANRIAGTVTVIDGASNASSSITVGAGASALAVNPVTNRIYVANTAGNTISVIDGATGTVTATLPAGTAPTGVAVNPMANKIYVTNSGSDDLTIVDGTNNATTTLAVGDGPSAVAVHPAFNRIYVANQNGNSVTVVEGVTGTVNTTVAVGAAPVALSVNSIHNRIFVTNRDGATVSIIDGGTHAVLTRATGAAPAAVTVNPVTNRAYVANKGAGTVTVIDAAVNATTDITVGFSSTAIAMDMVNNLLFAANQAGSVSVINGATGNLFTVHTAGARPWALAHDPYRSKVYSANIDSANVTVMDATGLSSTTVPAGALPFAIEVNPVTNRIYVANFHGDSVTVIDGETLGTTTVPVGTQPRSIAINLVTNRIYVANQNSSNVTVIDGLTGATTTVATAFTPIAVAVNPVTNKIYVACNVGAVTVIDGETGATTPVPVSAGVSAIAVNSVTNRIYVANQGSDAVTVIDGATNATVTVAVGDAPSAIAVNPVSNKVYVANRGGDSMTVIDGVTNSTSTLAVGDSPHSVVVNPVTGRVYVSNEGSSFISMVNTSTASFIPRAPNAGPIFFTEADEYAFNVPVFPSFGVNDVPVRTVYFRRGDGYGVHEPAEGMAPGPFTVAVDDLKPGYNYLSIFAMDAMEGTSINTSGGGAGGTGTWTGAPRVYAIVNIPPYVTTASVPGATEGTPYSASIAAKGISAPFTFAITQGSLPPGLFLGASGDIVGTPTAGGTFVFTVTATDPFGGEASREFSITVVALPPSSYLLSLSRAGTGAGTVASSPAGIACGATCSASFATGSVVTLTATAAGGSTFAGWSGSGCAGTGTCVVTLSAARAVTATFNLAPPVVPPVPTDPPRLANLSTRMQVLTGNDVLIGGFIIGGSSSKTVVVRARGPSLVPFGIANALANPQVQLVRSSDQATIAVNDNWGSAANAAAIGASGFAPSNPLESAILMTLPPGAYTAIVSGVGGGTGVGIFELFEVDAKNVPLINIATRGQVRTGNDVMIGGFVIQGSGPQAVVVRARGPSLIPFGIANALANPSLQLVRSSDQSTVATNDNWGSAANAAAINASGFAPSNALESAILVTLPPGAYTAIVTGVGGTTGVGIVEVFTQ